MDLSPNTKKNILRKVDVAINVYGKPYQTAVTILSLLKQSEQWIDKIYFVEERSQPYEANLDKLKKYLAGFNNNRNRKIIK